METNFVTLWAVTRACWECWCWCLDHLYSLKLHAWSVCCPDMNDFSNHTSFWGEVCLLSSCNSHSLQNACVKVKFCSCKCWFIRYKDICFEFESCYDSSWSRWLQVQGILRQYERITLCLHFCIYLFPFSPGLALWKTTDFSEEFSALNICSLMLLGEHGSAERRRAVAAIQGRRTLAFILSLPGFLQFSSSMPPRLQCVFPTLPFISGCDCSAQRLSEKNKGENGFQLLTFLGTNVQMHPAEKIVA